MCSLDQWKPELQSTTKCIQIFTNYKVLKYFITTKQLTSQQARWAKALLEYHFIIMYRTRKENVKADALTRQDNKVKLQDKLKTEYCTRAFLSQDQINPYVLQDLGININVGDISMALIKEPLFDKSPRLLDQILKDN